MKNTYKVTMSDSVNGERFKFSMHYFAAGIAGAGASAYREFGIDTMGNHSDTIKVENIQRIV